jgi:hypothetical protein
MGALRQPRLSEDTGSLRKPPQAETRKQLTPLEKLRARTDYDKGEGWSALPHAAFVDLLKLSSGEVCLKFIWAVNIALSSGSARSPREAWDAFTDFRSSQEWADSCAANVRDIQRQLSDLAERGMIVVKQIKASGGTQYAVSLLYRKWGALDSFAVWKRRQVVAIDEALGIDEPGDEELTAISKDAVHLTKKPQTVRPGRASRAVKISVGVREMCFENTSTTVDAVFQGVVTSGRLVVSATFRKGESEAKGEVKEKVARHVCRELPTNEGSQDTPTNEGSAIPAKKILPRAAELNRIFDPVLAHSGASLLSSDSSRKFSIEACQRIEDCDHDYLAQFVSNRSKIKSVLAVPDICAEALASWRASKVLDGAGLAPGSAKKKSFTDGVMDVFERRLKRDGKV